VVSVGRTRRAEPTPPPLISVPKPTPVAALEHEPAPAPTSTHVSGDERQRSHKATPSRCQNGIRIQRKTGAIFGNSEDSVACGHSGRYNLPVSLTGERGVGGCLQSAGEADNRVTDIARTQVLRRGLRPR
jgi:hypothetical protein